MDGFIQTLRKLGAVRLLAMGGVAIGLLIFFIFLATRLNTTNMALLYSGLDPTDSTKIVSKLESMAVPFQIKESGSQVLVPTERVASLRMLMAEEGLPDGGSVGYDIFDKSDTLGTTSFVQNVNLLRALEGELARSIRALNPVKEARVHLVLPKRELFSRQQQQPSASVILRTGGNARLGKTQVLAIQQLISAAVPGLKPNRISVIDHKGRLLARAGDVDNGSSVIASDNEEFRANKERQLTQRVEELIEQSVGVGKVRSRVTLEMDFDRITTNSELYDPDGQVVRSTQSVEENANSSEKDGSQSVSVANNLPDAGGTTDSASGNASRSARTEETVNYEISKTVRQHVRESGNIRRMSVAVLVDGVYELSEKGEQVYKPRSKEELDQLAALVRSAVGFNEARGDRLEVLNLRFIAGDASGLDDISPLLGLTKSDYFRIAEIFVLAIVGILVILLVVRPLVARTLDALPSALEAATEQNLLADQSEETAALTGPGGVGVSGGVEEEDELIDLDAVDGRVRSSTIKKIAEIVERHPEETVGIIRQWMYQES